MARAVGIRLAHESARGVLVTVAVPTRPFPPPHDLCPSCGVAHPHKTVHLWVEPDGTCLVSKGVLAELREAGMPGLSVVGHTDAPPTLALGRGATRAGIDFANRRIYQPTPIHT